MSIFLVLIFQVLFVLFAMVINIGLVVHDKINLQNSTDIAAYYAAQRQAELLNQIAHINYQIRQAYKLLVFRLRVPGSAAIGIPFSTMLTKHPIFLPPNPGEETTPFFNPPGGRRPPAVCVGSTLWKEYADTEGSDTVSLCKDLFQFSTPIANGTGGGPLAGLVGSLNNLLTAVAAEISLKCRQVGVLNYVLLSRWLAAYQLEAEKRGAMIDKLTAELVKKADEMVDMRGQSIRTGVEKTLQRNLTYAQKTSYSLTFQNSLNSEIGSAQCGDANFVFPKVEIFPRAYYVHMDFAANTCTTSAKSSGEATNMPPSGNLGLVPGGSDPQLASVFSNGGPVSMGIEKNPWCMPYMRVRVTSAPRKIFAPFGGTVNLQAEAFAKPFGGRIGPWYSKSWPSGAATSQGTERTDPLLPARSIAGSIGAGDPAGNVVNHSKYPGDQLGMNSKYALAIMHSRWITIAGNNEAALVPGMALAHYNHIGNPAVFESDADSLVRDNGSISAESMRRMEQMAIAPDLFDLTYYSIEARYDDNYVNPNLPNFRTFISGNELYADLGSQNRQPYNIVNQIQAAQTVAPLSGVFYLADDPSQLLTGWTQNKAVNYEFPVSTFGRCVGRTDDESPALPAPGGCPVGGRSGYSVKIVSKNYLQNVSAALGGPGVVGPILNPPSD